MNNQTIDDKRLFERFEAHFPAKVKDAREGFGAKISLRDACAEGIKLITKERFYVNDSVALEVKIPDGKDPLNLRGQVVWAHLNEASNWEIGVKFHKTRLAHMSRLYKYVLSDFPSST